MLTVLNCMCLQIAFYEQAKQILLSTGYFRDNTTTHFSSSFIAVNIYLFWSSPPCVFVCSIPGCGGNCTNTTSGCNEDKTSERQTWRVFCELISSVHVVLQISLFPSLSCSRWLSVSAILPGKVLWHSSR